MPPTPLEVFRAFGAQSLAPATKPIFRRQWAE